MDDDVDVAVVVESGNGERRDDDDDDSRPPPPKNRFVVAVVNVFSGDAKEVNKWLLLLLQLLYVLLVAP